MHVVVVFGIEEVRKGNPPSVDIMVTRVGGNKHLTKIRGLGYYGIDENTLTTELSKKFATTCTFHQVQEGKVGAVAVTRIIF